MSVNGWTPLVRATMASYFGNWLNDIYKNKDIQVFPHQDNVFKAFRLCPYEDTKVVIIGQDPYHGCKITTSLASKDPIIIPEANGLAFSVHKNIPVPPSLRNIFKSLHQDTGIQNTNPDLYWWAKQGVLLLNTALTVIKDTPGSHTAEWRPFTESVIDQLNQHPNRLVFLLWGKHAQSFKSHINTKHIILETSHPSPFSAHKGFLECKHFSKTNELLQKLGYEPIDWKIP